MARPSGIITLITDFGTRDGYVGALKGVILGINPAARIVDISHHIGRHDRHHAALVLRHVCPYFPAGSVHLLVVDPGVGGPRKPLLAETEKFFFLGPDNGELYPALMDHQPFRAVAIESAQYRLPQMSDTFHGRDLFATAAAHLTLGVPLEQFGPRLDEVVSLELPRAEKVAAGLRGQVIAVDVFGNLITNISRQDLAEQGLAGQVAIRIAGTSISGISSSYQEVPPGSPLAIIDSWDLLEIAVNRGDARSSLGAGRGDAVLVTYYKSKPTSLA